MVPTAAHCIVRFTRLVLDRKVGFRIWNVAQITMSPTSTGIEPRSPARTRLTTSVNQPRTPPAGLARSSC